MSNIFSSTINSEEISFDEIGTVALINTSLESTLPTKAPVISTRAILISTEKTKTSDGNGYFTFKDEHGEGINITFSRIALYDNDGELITYADSTLYMLQHVVLRCTIEFEIKINIAQITAEIVSYDEHQRKCYTNLFNIHTNINKDVATLGQIVSDYMTVTQSKRNINITNLDNSSDNDFVKLITPSIPYELRNSKSANSLQTDKEDYYLNDPNIRLRIFNNFLSVTNNMVFKFTQDGFNKGINVTSYNYGLNYSNYYFTDNSQGLVIPTVEGIILVEYNYYSRWSIKILYGDFSEILNTVHLRPDVFSCDGGMYWISFGSSINILFDTSSKPLNSYYMKNNIYRDGLDNIYKFDTHILDLNKVNPIVSTEVSLPVFEYNKETGDSNTTSTKDISYMDIPVSFYDDTSYSFETDIIPNQLTSFNGLYYKKLYASDLGTIINKDGNEESIKIDSRVFHDAKFYNAIMEPLKQIIDACLYKRDVDIERDEIWDIVLEGMKNDGRETDDNLIEDFEPLITGGYNITYPTNARSIEDYYRITKYLPNIEELLKFFYRKLKIKFHDDVPFTYIVKSTSSDKTEELTNDGLIRYFKPVYNGTPSYLKIYSLNDIYKLINTDIVFGKNYIFKYLGVTHQTEGSKQLINGKYYRCYVTTQGEINIDIVDSIWDISKPKQNYINSTRFKKHEGTDINELMMDSKWEYISQLYTLSIGGESTINNLDKSDSSTSDIASESYVMLSLIGINELISRYYTSIIQDENNVEFKICDEGIIVINKMYDDVDIISVHKLFFRGSDSNDAQNKLNIPIPKNSIYNIDMSGGKVYINKYNNGSWNQTIIDLNTNSKVSTSNDIIVSKYDDFDTIHLSDMILSY